jgi:hypothetical protein
MTDWYFTDTKKRGFTARPVVGGVFAQMLYDGPCGKMGEPRPDQSIPLGADSTAAESLPYSAADKQPNVAIRQRNPRMIGGAASTMVRKRTSGFGRKAPGAVIGTTWNTPDIGCGAVEIPADKLKTELWFIMTKTRRSSSTACRRACARLRDGLFRRPIPPPSTALKAGRIDRRALPRPAAAGY